MQSRISSSSSSTPPLSQIESYYYSLQRTWLMGVSTKVFPILFPIFIYFTISLSLSLFLFSLACHLAQSFCLFSLFWGCHLPVQFGLSSSVIYRLIIVITVIIIVIICKLDWERAWGEMGKRKAMAHFKHMSAGSRHTLPGIFFSSCFWQHCTHRWYFVCAINQAASPWINYLQLSF